MLTYTFSNESGEPLYQQLYRFIKEDIMRGNLTAEEKLPSRRAFAKNLGISTITVENAYAQLIAEGFLYSLPQKGYFVTDMKTFLPARENEMSGFTEGARERAEHREAFPKEQERHYLADFTSNQTSSGQFPFSVWAKLLRKTLKQEQALLMKNAPGGGVWPLREAIAGHLHDFRGMEVQPWQIIVGAGTEYLYGLLLQLFGMEKRYGVENPGYHKIGKIYGSHHVSCSYVAMDHAGVKIEDLEEQRVDVVHISPSHHFPTGIVMPVSRRYELLDWTRRKEGRYIIEDDYDSEFRLSGKPIPPLQSIDTQGKVVYMNTFTKTLSSTIRISYMVLPEQLAGKFQEEFSFYSSTVSNFEQYTLTRFIAEGYFEKHMNRMRNYYHEKRDLLLRKIAESPLADYVTILEEDAGLHFLMRIHTAMPDEELRGRLERKGVKISSLAQYDAKPSGQENHVFIMNYSSLEESLIDEVILIFYHAITGEQA